MKIQHVDLYQPMANTRVGPAPVALRIANTSNNNQVAGGVPNVPTKVETYVLLSALPAELQERVKIAVQALLSGV